MLTLEQEIATAQYVGAHVFIDALGQSRCGLTGVLTTACGCYYNLAYGILPSPGYRGQPTVDDDTGEFFIPKGQAPLAITAGDEHEPWPIDWHPFNAVHCGECGREIEQDQALDGQPGWTHVFND